MKFAIPTHASWSAQPGSEVIETKLDGGRSRRRKDVLNSAPVLSVSWQLNAAEFDYFLAFFSTITQSGALPFEIDLSVETAAQAEYTANFVANSVSYAEQSGIYTVTAKLEVEPIARDETADTDLVNDFNAAHGA